MNVARAVFIGDELTAAGWRLAGLETHAPAAERVADCLERVLRAEPPLVLIGASVAGVLAAGALEEMLVSAAPPALVVADATGAAVPVDLPERVRRELGVR
ncbi:MAG TPA: hypothetical protein VFA86_11705 [Gammaproteobacteria bacterium]|nr:hypothetical protein [Gammaproteobacteria bacterium]